MAKRKTKRQKNADTIKLPGLWADEFRRSTMRTNFVLSLSQAMIEYLSAVADGVQWDRMLYPHINRPDNWLATQAALTKRGLIERRSREEIDAAYEAAGGAARGMGEVAFSKLTPAGEAVVQLLRVTGIFVEADAAINKQSRRG